MNYLWEFRQYHDSGVLCGFHGGCPDGLSAAAAVWSLCTALDIPIKALPLGYDTATEKILSYMAQYPETKAYVFVDFTPPLEVIQQLRQRDKDVWIADHHETQAPVLKQAGDLGCYVAYDTRASGAYITWKLVHNRVPEIVKFVSERDTWTFSSPESELIGRGFLSVPSNRVEDWAELIERSEDDPQVLRDLALAGEVIGNVITKSLASPDETDFIQMRLRDQVVLAVNAPLLRSDVLHEVLEGTDYDVVAAYNVMHNGVAFSLRSRKGTVNVGELAQQYGGGGHAEAAGFRVPLETFAEFLKAAEQVRPVGD